MVARRHAGAWEFWGKKTEKRSGGTALRLHAVAGTGQAQMLNDEPKEPESVDKRREEGEEEAGGRQDRPDEGLPPWFPEWRVSEEADGDIGDGQDPVEESTAQEASPGEEPAGSDEQMPGRSDAVEPPEWPEEWRARMPRTTSRQADRDAVDPPDWPDEWQQFVRRSVPRHAVTDGADAAADADGPAEAGVVRQAPLYWRVFQAVANPILVRLGFRRLADQPRGGLGPPPRRYASEREPAVLRRVAILVASLLAVTAVVVLCLWVYSMTRPARKTGQESTEPLLLAAAERLRAGNGDVVERVRDELVATAPNSVARHFAEGYLVGMRESDYESARGRLGSDPEQTRSVDDLVAWAGYFRSRENRMRMVDVLEEALRRAPDNTHVRLLLAEELLAMGQPVRALDEADRIEQQDGLTMGVCDVRGRAYLMTGQYRLALREFQTESLCGGPLVRVHSYLADTYLQLGEYDNAVGELEAVFRQQPRNVTAKVRLGLLYERGNRLDDAEGAYLDALQLAPENVPALNNLAYLLSAKKGRPDRGVVYAERAHEAASDNPSVLDTLAWTYHLLGRDAEALPLVERAAESAPNNHTIQFHRAVVLAEHGDEADRKRARELLTSLASRTEGTGLHEQVQKQLSALD